MPEQKPFDLKDLEEMLKAKGLPEVEDLAKKVFEGICEWTENGITASPSKVDDFALAVLPAFKSFIVSKLDGISK